MSPNPQFPTDLVTFTEEILNRKLHFLCSVCHTTVPFIRRWTYFLFPNPIYLFNRVFSLLLLFLWSCLFFASKSKALKCWQIGIFGIIYQLKFYRIKLGNIRELSQLLRTTSQSVFLPNWNFCHYLEKNSPKNI